MFLNYFNIFSNKKHFKIQYLLYSPNTPILKMHVIYIYIERKKERKKERKSDGSKVCQLD
jgi:hypothetical protein